MVNAVMDAIALLSSLATDLDIMLNDLRSSPSSRLSSSPHHLHPRSTAGYTPFSINIGSNNSTAASHNATNQSNNYLQNAAIHNSATSNYQGINEQKPNRDDFGSAEYSNDYSYRTNQRHQQESQQRQQQNKDNQTSATASATASASASASLLVTAKQEKLNQTLSANCNQQQQHFNQNVADNGNLNNCQRERQQQQTQQEQLSRYSDGNNKCNDDSGGKYTSATTATGSHAKNRAIATPTPTTASSSSFQGLSTDATRISKLPLYTYQHKQLQQPQTLHIKLLQQQQATKAIASQITSTAADIQQNVFKKRTIKMNDSATTNNSYNNYGKNNSSCHNSGNNGSSKKKFNCGNVSCKAACTRTTTTNPLTTTPSSSLDFRIKSIAAAAASLSSTTSSSLSSSSSTAIASGKSTHIYKINSSSNRNASSTAWLQSTSVLTSSKSTSSSTATAAVSASASSSSCFHR